MNSTPPPFTAPAQLGSMPRRPPTYTAFVPVLMILVILILSSLKDIVTLIRRKNALLAQHAQAMEPLRFAGRQAEFIDSLHDDLVKVAPSDPAAAAILTEFFPPPATPPNPVQPNKDSGPQNQVNPR